jgi:hypothetical protein
MLVLLIILMGLCLGVGGCASRIYAHSALASGDSPSAELVVLREREFSLGALALLVSLDEEKLARLRTGHFAEFRVQPGNYQLAIGDLGIPGRVKRVVFDPIQLAAGTRTYVIFGKQGELRWNDTKLTPYCLTGRCGRIGKSLRSESITLVFGFDRLTEGEAKALMTKYEPVRARLAAMGPEEKQRMRERDVDQAEATEPQLLVQLDESDPLVRADAVSLLPIFGEGAEGAERFQRVATLLAEDPDRSVRIAAAERLGEFDSPESVKPLVLALSDADRDVVLAAIEALADVDDASAIPDLELLVKYYDEEIRDAAELAIQSIE